uniref:Uncharacterized protein n=1 Tax=Caenorhabditis japonica TaxID=281687 RepID=A0A8R1EIB2_CAEJA
MLPFRCCAVLKMKPWTRSRCIWTAAIFVLQKLSTTSTDSRVRRRATRSIAAQNAAKRGATLTAFFAKNMYFADQERTGKDLEGIKDSRELTQLLF